jgi:hypothetical protein
MKIGFILEAMMEEGLFEEITEVNKFNFKTASKL